jgi:hypothetical protein
MSMIYNKSGRPGRDALLIGSIPLADAATVFRTAGEILGSYLRQVPDGETGPRSNWIGWQLGVMRAATFLTQRQSTTGYGAVMVDLFSPRDPTSDPSSWEFGSLGYASSAISSYSEFRRLKVDGVLPPDIKFQVSLPTPLAPVTSFIEPDFYVAVEQAYERRMRSEIDAILRTVPAEELAIQWDTAVEFALLEGVFPGALVNRRDLIVERLVGLTSWVPQSVELGFHLCYGDADHKHFIEPKSTALLVDVANAVLASSRRRIDWLHLPVPKSRDDLDYFEPLSALRRPKDMRVYLGLLHLGDGLEGARSRVQAANNFVADFGIATECGFGRRPVDHVVPLLQLHASMLRELNNTIS